VARGFGAFDDATAGAEIFGRAGFLDEIGSTAQLLEGLG
jgi:hypothetical protein